MMDKKYMEKNKVIYVLVFVAALLLVLSTLGTASFVYYGGSDTGQIVLVNTYGIRDITLLNSMDVEILDRYGDFVLIEADTDSVNSLQSVGLEVNLLPNRERIYVKGYEIDITEGEPELCSELTIEDYRPGTKGLYIIHMLGPVNPQWLETLDTMGVQLINYLPNYAYEVRMTPEQAKEVYELFFVDWIGLYHPAYKLAPDLEPGLVNIILTEGFENRLLNTIAANADILSIDELVTYGTQILAEVSDESVFAELAMDPDVYYVSMHGEPELLGEVASQIIGGGVWLWDPDDDPYNPWRGHNDEFDYGAFVNHMGYSGDGITVAVADTGINPDHLDFQDRVIGGYYWSGNTWSDGNGHGSHCAGSIAGNTHLGTGRTIDEFGMIQNMGPFYAGQGLAYESDLYSVRVFSDGGTWSGPSNHFLVVEVAAQNTDAYVHSNSWGGFFDGRYDSRSSNFDAAVRDSNRDTPDNQPMVIVVAVGNEGRDNTIGCPATGKNVISVGATENFMPEPDFMGNLDNPDNVASFSSRGWTNDNRVKPDVMAPGHGIISTGNEGPEQYLGMSGTSMACPAAAGAATIVVEWYEDIYGVRPSPAMVKALLINTAYDLDDDNGNTGPIPNNYEGWGLINLPALMDAPSTFMMEDQTSLLTTGETDEYSVLVMDPTEPVKITLTWTDHPASAGETWTLKNDLNLEVISPSGLVYTGNAFQDGWTVSGQDTMSIFDRNDDGTDDVNNVENVYIHPDYVEPGIYTVRVNGYNIPMDANNDGNYNQDYALVGYNVDDYIPGEPPVITLTSPTGGEVFDAYDEEFITWTASEGDDPVDRIALWYSADSGSSWTIIDTSIPDTGSYLWEVPNENSEDCLIRAVVYDELGRNGEDISGETFRIIGVPPSAPANINVAHFELRDNIDNGIFMDNYQPWELERLQTGGESRWDAQGQNEGGAIYLMAEQIGSSGTKVEEAYWMQELPSISKSMEISGSYRRVLSRQDNSFDHIDDAIVEIQIHDTDTGWQTVFINEDRSWGDTGWVNTGTILYEPSGTVDAIRARMHVTARTRIIGQHAKGELRMDNIQLVTEEHEGGAHNRISWDASPDDPHEVSHYNVYRSEDSDGPWGSPITTVSATGSSSYVYIDENKGDADEIVWWYVVRSLGSNGLEEQNTASYPEPGASFEVFDIPLTAGGEADGWNFVSFNLIPTTTSLESILDDIDGSYDRVMYYDASIGRWSSYIPGRAARYNNLDTWNHRMGLWLQASDGVTLSIEGTVPVSTDVTLYPGWNMIGLPSVLAGNHGLPAEVDTIGYFQASASNNIVYDHNPTNFVFEPGKGYWVHNPTDTTLSWEVSYDG